MSRELRNSALGYAIALLAVAATLGLRLRGEIPFFREAPFLSLGVGTLVAAGVGGWGPGLAATVLGAAGVFLADRWGLGPAAAAAQSLPVVAVFALTGAAFSGLIGALHAARRRAEVVAAGHRNGEALFRSLFERSPIPMYVYDVASLRFLAVNDSALQHYGYGRDEFLAMTIEQVRPDGADPKAGRLSDPDLDRMVRLGVWRHRKRDGTAIDVDVTHTSLPFAGRPARLVVAVDVTDRVRAEAELRRATREAEEARGVLGRFLAVLSHELSTPMGPVLPAVSLLLDDGGELPPGVRPVLEMVRRNVELQARLIDDVRDVVRAERGKLRLDPEPVDVHELVGRVVEICRADLEAAGVRLALDLSAGRSRVVADPARLQQVLWNLLKNAAKFTPAGGAVGVSTRLAHGRLVVEVSDTGAGIAPGDLERIFDPFEQGRPAHPPGPRGGDANLGLGLAISRSIAEAHGGRLVAHSDGPGLGSRFVLDLALAPVPPTAPLPIPAPGPAPARPLKVLLVDDNEDILSHLALALGRRGHAVTIAESLASALGALADSRFDLLISDLQLPDGSGLDLMRAAREAGRVPGIALSGYGSDEDVRLSRDAGFSAHLAKPVPFARLESTIRRVMAEPATVG